MGAGTCLGCNHSNDQSLSGYVFHFRSPGENPVSKAGHLRHFKKHGCAGGSSNVVAKILSLITEAGWNDWTVADLRLYVTHAIEAFGFKLLLFGGDWPVILVAGTYKK
jgi:L-fuconolactonase